ncbi:MAG: molybdopterin-guanine dinucleotide biosynthesis protein MobA [Frankia sp.]|nr:molybdopterin-guanine dinucleotide biosynthesis protein MobA [Frankia sp.]
MSALGEWVDEAGRALGLDPDAINVTELLDLTRDVAHGVARPAAPLTAFLVGLAAGRAGGDAAAVARAVGVVRSLLAERPAGAADGG